MANSCFKFFTKGRKVKVLDPYNLNAILTLQELMCHMAGEGTPQQLAKIFESKAVYQSPKKEARSRSPSGGSGLGEAGSAKRRGSTTSTGSGGKTSGQSETSEPSVLDTRDAKDLFLSHCTNLNLKAELPKEEIYALYEDVIGLNQILKDIKFVDEYAGLLCSEAETKVMKLYESFPAIVQCWNVADKKTMDLFQTPFLPLCLNSFSDLDNSSGVSLLSMMYVWVLKYENDIKVEIDPEFKDILEIGEGHADLGNGYKIVNFLDKSGFINTEWFVKRVGFGSIPDLLDYVSTLTVGNNTTYVDLARFWALLDAISLFNALMLLKRLRVSTRPKMESFSV